MTLDRERPYLNANLGGVPDLRRGRRARAPAGWRRNDPRRTDHDPALPRADRAARHTDRFTATRRAGDPGKLARVSSLDFLLSYGPAPAGLALITPTIDAVGITAVLGVCAAVCFAAPAAAALVAST